MVIRIKDEAVQLGIEAPPEITVDRDEIHRKILKEGRRDRRSDVCRTVYDKTPMPIGG